MNDRPLGSRPLNWKCELTLKVQNSIRHLLVTLVLTHVVKIYF